MLNSGVLLGRAKICACAIEGRASMKRSLSPDWHPARKETIAGFTLSVTFRPSKKILTLKLTEIPEYSW